MRSVFTNLSLSGLIVLATLNCKSPESPVAEESAARFQRGERGSNIVHLFNYPFKTIIKELPDLDKTGFNYIQISPPNLTKGDSTWYNRYQPLDYRVIDGPLGTEEELKDLITQANKYKIGIIADVVFNHMADLGKDFDLSYPPAQAKEKYKVDELFSAQDFHPAFCIKDYNDPEQVRNGRLCDVNAPSGLPDLDPNDHVIDAQRQYLKRLLDLGVKGFRFDAIKHFEPSHVKLLVDNLPSNILIFGEIITSRSNWDRDLTPYMSSTPKLGYMDFILNEALRNSFGFNGNLANLVEPEKSRRSLDSERSVTFTVNHDIPQNDIFNSMIMDPKDEELAYVYIFSRGEGFTHTYSDLGKADRLKFDRWKQAHRSPLIKTLVSFRNRLESKKTTYPYSDKCHLVINRESVGVALINKCGEPWMASVSDNFQGSYRDLLTNTSFSSNEGTIELEVPPRSARLLLRN